MNAASVTRVRDSVDRGSRLGPYRVVGPLGAGGMGLVVRALDPRLGRSVAIKLLYRDAATDERRLRQFMAEARAASALNHPNILTVYEIGTSERGPYLVTELVEGETLRTIANRAPSRSISRSTSCSRPSRACRGRTRWESCTGTSSPRT